MFLDSNKLSYLGGMLEMANERLYPFWGSLTEGLRTGLPQNEIKTGGAGLFESIYGNPQRLRLFLGAMTGLSMGASQAIARKFPWETIRGWSTSAARREVCWFNSVWPILISQEPALTWPWSAQSLKSPWTKGPAQFSDRRFFQRAVAAGGCDNHGPHLARLESG